MRKRPIIVHYHLFKNAGTSVDAILQHNFGENWTEVEGPGNRELDPQGLLKFIRDNQHLEAVSSHTAKINIPETDDLEIIPMIFVRHPIVRIRSAYNFERKQNAQTPGAIKAKQGDFTDYMNWRLSTPTPWQVSNFHAFKLKDFHQDTPARQMQLFLPRALKALDDLPFVGIVEQFDTSMHIYADIIRNNFPSFETYSVAENTNSDPSLGNDMKLEKFKEEVGSDTIQKLLEINGIDLEIYNVAREKFSQIASPEGQ